MKQIFKKTSAWLPIAMSFLAILFTTGYVTIVGVSKTSQSDEGIAAHLFQLLMGGQVPIIAFFIIKWLPKMLKQAVLVLFIQFLAMLAAFGLVFFFEM